MKRILAVFAIIMVAFVYVSCGNSPAPDSAAPSASASPGYYEPAPNTALDLTAQQNIPKEKKIVRNASLGLEVENTNAAYIAIKNWLTNNGGYEFASNTSKDGDYWYVNAELKVLPENLDAFIEFAKTLGEMINCSISSEDITDQYVDAQIRLNTARKNLEKYYEFLAKASTIDESMRVQSEINVLTSDIEAMEGKLKLWDSQTKESTVSLIMREKRDPVKIKKEIDWNALTFDDMLYLARNGIVMTTNLIVTLIQWILIILVAVLPLALVLGVIFLVGRKIKSKIKTKPKQKDSEPNKNTNEIK